MKATPAMVSAGTVCEAPEALTAVGSSATATIGGIRDGRVHKSRHHHHQHNHPRRDIENEEIQMYLSKLKELVPFMPKNKRLSKLEVIQHVIDYICHLQHTLEAHPAAARIAAVAASATAAVAAAAAVNGSGNSPSVNGSPSPSSSMSSASGQGPSASSPRQPLGVIAPNTIPNVTTCAVQEHTTPVHLDKVVASDSRPVSC
ncbi:neurogenin-2 [Hetaerina americana]|uniref:neurogenin-2 n=1 Tax=Hetaerina americana TaxID=62018 RepID=UPI003A7F16D5